MIMFIVNYLEVEDDSACRYDALSITVDNTNVTIPGFHIRTDKPILAFVFSCN